jgi:hypothetical protein
MTDRLLSICRKNELFQNFVSVDGDLAIVVVVRIVAVAVV